MVGQQERFQLSFAVIEVHGAHAADVGRDASGYVNQQAIAQICQFCPYRVTQRLSGISHTPHRPSKSMTLLYHGAGQLQMLISEELYLVFFRM